MFEKEIQFITDFNLNKIKSLSSSFILDELFRVELHPALIKYISGRVDLLLYEERKILLENSRFDYSGAKIAEYFNLISDEIKKTKKISNIEVEDYIKKGVIFNANFCAQPKSTLTNLIFKNTDGSKSTAEIKVYLNFIYYYDYLKEIINSYFSKKKIVSLGKEEFREILDKIDNELLISKREDIISDALNSISDFYNDGGITRSSIQSSLVEAFLKEKNLIEFIDLLHKEIKDNKKKAEIDELKKIIFSKPAVKPELPEVKVIEEVAIKAEREVIIEPEIIAEPEVNAKAEIETKPEAKTKPETKTRPESKTKPETKIKPEAKSETKPLIKFKDEKNAESKKIIEKDKIIDKNDVVEEPIRSEIIELKTENKKNDLNEENDEIQETILEEEIIEGEQTESEELIEEYFPPLKEIKKEKDIFSFLGTKEVDKISSVIFNDDEDDFINTIEKISLCSGYEQASEILKSVFFTYRVDPYKREAVILTNAVSNYFHQG